MGVPEEIRYSAGTIKTAVAAVSRFSISLDVANEYVVLSQPPTVPRSAKSILIYTSHSVDKKCFSKGYGMGND